MQHCEHCGKDFYSDTDFEAHSQVEMIKKIAEGNAGLLQHIIQNLNLLNVQQIIQREHIGVSEAARRFFEYVDAFNEIGREVNERWRIKHGVV